MLTMHSLRILSLFYMSYAFSGWSIVSLEIKMAQTSWRLITQIALTTVGTLLCCQAADTLPTLTLFKMWIVKTVDKAYQPFLYSSWKHCPCLYSSWKHCPCQRVASSQIDYRVLELARILKAQCLATLAGLAALGILPAITAGIIAYNFKFPGWVAIR